MPRDVPEQLRLVESFLNSVDVETDEDDFDAVPRFRRWLDAHGLPAAGRSATEADLTLARELRSALRQEVAAHHDGHGGDRSELTALASRIGLVAAWDTAGNVTLRPTDSGVAGVLAEIIAAIVLASRDRTWQRMKLCPADDCQAAYYDRSRNSSRRWCSMEVCGNRNKTRAYRQRSTG